MSFPTPICRARSHRLSDGGDRASSVYLHPNWRLNFSLAERGSRRPTAPRPLRAADRGSKQREPGAAAFGFVREQQTAAPISLSSTHPLVMRHWKPVRPPAPRSSNGFVAGKRYYATQNRAAMPARHGIFIGTRQEKARFVQLRFSKLPLRYRCS